MESGINRKSRIYRGSGGGDCAMVVMVVVVVVVMMVLLLLLLLIAHIGSQGGSINDMLHITVRCCCVMQPDKKFWPGNLISCHGNESITDEIYATYFPCYFSALTTEKQDKAWK